jgi:hypothetical protein
MEKLLTFVFLLLSLHSFAGEYKHQLSFGRQGLGWGGSYEEMDTESQSPFKEGSHLFNDFALNYAYRVGNCWQIGGFFQSDKNDFEFKRKDEGSTFANVTRIVGGIFGLYNFSEELQQAYYLGAAISYFTLAEENSHNWTEMEGKAPFELDDAGTSIELIFGKRFSFDKWEIKHLTYSPSLSLFIRTHSKDFDDQNVGTGKGIALQPVKFDFLF